MSYRTGLRKRVSSRAKSWIAIYEAAGGGTMLGGVRKSKSSRFGNREDALRRLQSAIEINATAGRAVRGRVISSSLAPEIFAHCPGSWAQAIGGHCFGCRKKLTAADARDYAARG